ncbi:UDP-glycosyltransferase 74F2-like [Olea europaea var. sylvestris]|uniref:anthocyanidin 3-O-glucoside 5-O-glucosyltransferase n=1 Tax=Olea europaea subsp. europaea TaxID=158383 RepID=A0A8S0SSA0_OLEEU|nr:UDP-glycosyltransferase 74F2-like [Olea europaea var. sylvestris]CAA2995240.1 UDP-glycosyltransferase 74F2-like [Olea europaea subsp. europaea]
MEKRTEEYKAHCLILPFPSQGHINPMLQFAKRLRHKGVKITLAATKHIFKTMQDFSGSVSVETISDGYDEGGLSAAKNDDEYLARFRKVGTETLEELIKRLKNSRCALDCIVYDAFIPWSLDVAKTLGLVGAAFFTQSCAVDQIYYHVYKGDVKLPLSESEISIPGLPPLKPSDMPSFLYVHGSYPPLKDMVVNQFQSIEKADWLLFNTFHKLEEEVIDWMAKFSPVKAIGPAVPSMYLDKRIEDDREYGINVYKPITGACMEWLDKRESDSVIYVSFGSLAELGKEQMEELAWGLKLSNMYFLWIVRASEESKLPKDFAEETCEKGLILSWCPQLDVLAHNSVGCFGTHCGWNSTLEALSLGVPMVAMPQWTDQSTNAKYVMDVWKMGIRAPPDENGMVSRDTICYCTKQVMEGETGKQIKKNATKWKELAREAVDKGGSSDTNIEEFVSKLVHEGESSGTNVE